MNENDIPEHKNDNPETSVVNPAAEANASELDAEQTTTSKKPRSKKPIILLLLLVVLTGAIAVWFLLVGGKNESSTETKSTETNANDENKPRTRQFLYAVNKGEGVAATEVFGVPMDGGDAEKLFTLPEGEFVSRSEINGENVLLTTYMENGEGGEKIYASTDGGRTFSAVFEAKAPSSETNMGEQVTSAIFSEDGKHIVAGIATSDMEGNTAKRIDLVTKKTTDLFTVDTIGLFIESYDQDDDLVYYFTGCYNCDGVYRNKLLSRDTRTDTESVVYAYEDNYGSDVVFNDEITKTLILKSTPGDGLGGGLPYFVDEFNLSAKSVQRLTEFNEAPEIGYVQSVGYREGDNKPYVVVGNRILTLQASAEPSTAFEAAEPILYVHEINKDEVIVSIGEYQKFKTIRFDLAANMRTDLMSGSDRTVVIGVTKP